MMTQIKTAVFALFAFGFASVAQAGDFLSDYETAKKKAKEENKPLLVKFTGSDWCPPCKALNKAIYSKKEFKTAVEKDFVVAVLDFPRSKKLPEGQLEKNRGVAKEFGIRGYPTVLLIDQKGKVIKKMVGGFNGEVKDYLKILKSAVKAGRFL